MNININAVFDKYEFLSAEEHAKDIFSLVYDDSERSKEEFELAVGKIVQDDNYYVIVALRSLYKLSKSLNTVRQIPQWATKILEKYEIIPTFNILY